MTLPQLADATLSVENRIALFTLNRHDLRNALTGSQLVDDITTLVNWVNQTAEVSVVVITGAGSSFSAGGNIKEMHERKGAFAGNVEELEERYRRGIQRIPLAMSKLEVPAIAAINGAAIGAGFDLACMADLRIASDKAIMGETFLNLGIIPGDGGSWFLQRLVGYQRAAELCFTGRILDANEAQELGLVLQVVEHDKLLDETMALASKIASQPPKALRLTKRLLKTAMNQELSQHLDLCATYQGMCHQTEEHTQAVERMINTIKK